MWLVEEMLMERIDKVISSQTNYSRKEVMRLVKNGLVMVNGEVISKACMKVNPDIDKIKILGNELKVKKYVYLVLNKPKGFISATEDRSQRTVLELVPLEYMHRSLFPAGRLDKDTTGLMIITDDGEFAHNILSPRKHISKTYNVVIDKPVSEEMVRGFIGGVMLNDGECKTAELEITGDYTARVVLTEGRYHQIKRMFGCFGAKVLELERIKMGNLELPKDLKMGECRELTLEELKKITK